MWKPVKGFEGLYEVSDIGEVRSLPRTVHGQWGEMKLPGKTMKLQTSKKGYSVVILHKECKGFTKQVHRLVAEAFIENPDNAPQVNHIDTNKKNNNVSNLEWCTNEYNMRHAFANGCFRNDHARRAERARHLNGTEYIKRAVVCLDANGNMIGEYRSISEASQKTGANASKITDVCRGHRNRTNNLIFKYKEDFYEFI